MNDSFLEQDSWRQLEEPSQRVGFDKLLGDVSVCHLGPGRAAVRIGTSADSANVFGSLHGGFLAAVAEQTMFVPLYLDGRVSRAGVVTVDFSARYMTGGVCGEALEMELEVLHETGRLAFVRGTMRQGGRNLLAYEATLRKVKG